jgi:hypothetical protein
MTMPPANRNVAPRLELPPGLEAVYVNLVRISHTPAEIIFDYARLLPGQIDSLQVLSRLIMSPVGAKLFWRALGENLARYEASFGEIALPNDSTLANDLFRTIQPPDLPPGG